MLFFYPDFSNGAAYEPSGMRETRIITDLLAIKKGDRAADLGSGDGRIVIAMAKKGALTFGLEKDEKLVELSRKKIATAGLCQTAFIYQTNFWQENLSTFSKIAIFQYYTIMAKLEKKLQMELMPGVFVVSHHWQFPHWRPVRQILDIYLYQK